MSETDRIIGAVQEFMNQTKDRLSRNDQDHQKIIESLEDLKAFKLKVVGAAAAMSAIASAMVKFL